MDNQVNELGQKCSDQNCCHCDDDTVVIGFSEPEDDDKQETEDDKLEVEDEEKDEEKDTSRQLRYYVVKAIDMSLVSKKAAVRFIEDEIDNGKDKDKFCVIKGKQLELNFETKTKVVIK